MYNIVIWYVSIPGIQASSPPYNFLSRILPCNVMLMEASSILTFPWGTQELPVGCILSLSLEDTWQHKQPYGNSVFLSTEEHIVNP